MAKTELLVSIPNGKVGNWLGEPLKISMDGVLSEVDVTELTKLFLRSRATDGQSLVVKSLEDAQHVRDVGRSLQATDDGVFRLSFGDHKWLLDKAKEIGFRFLPNDITLFIEALEAGQKANVPVESQST